MCGIFGYIGARQAAPILLKGLKRLEYRGYDSAGVAVLNGSGRISLRKQKGKVNDLAQALAAESLHGSVGIGHTRWATHGPPNDVNAHPHLDCSGRLAVIHNGIIENHAALRAKLEEEGHRFRSNTDSEVLAHLIEKYRPKCGSLRRALAKAVSRARGSYAIGVISADEPDRILAARSDSPLVIGVGNAENFISSDIAAVLDHTRDILTIENGEVVELDARSVVLSDAGGAVIRRKPKKIQWSVADAEKQGYPHFMLKEIFEQPGIIEGVIRKRIRGQRIVFEEMKIAPNTFRRIRNVTIVACGTSYHAGLVGRYAMEQLTPFAVSVDTSSEFRYRQPKVGRQTLVIVISQSGETADTLAALREAKKRGALTLAICNVLGSSIEREAHGVIYTYAGPEIAVASTKAYTAQLAVLYLIAFYLQGQVFSSRPSAAVKKLLKEFKTVPVSMREVLDDYWKDRQNWDKNVHRFNIRYHEQLERYVKSDPEHRKRVPNGFFLFLGRNINYPSALEGALKLKEIAYISAEGYAAGEMKHGPIALIDENPWVICVAVESSTYDKMIGNIQEIRARGGIVTAIVTKGDEAIKKLRLFIYIEIPKICELLSPLVVALPLQLIAYTVAKEFSEDIDQPRNLAKSVTVE